MGSEPFTVVVLPPEHTALVDEHGNSELNYELRAS